MLQGQLGNNLFVEREAFWAGRGGGSTCQKLGFLLAEPTAAPAL